MTDQDFFAQMQIGIPHIPSPAGPAPILIGIDLASGPDIHVDAGFYAINRKTIMEKPTYSWSFDEETYHGDFGSIDDAMKAAFDREVRTADAGELRPGVHIGENEPFSPASHLGAEEFIDWAQQQMYDELGEQSEDFLGSVTDEQQQELVNFLADWLGRADAGSRYWKVNNSAFRRFADYGLSQDAA